ncbi:MAG: TauD/TfdA family dioxygenase [Acidimicrobiales bacterium]|nr:TauD/TfdA family dioxygenase [Acidimicrobiales bacterium]HRW37611.1 TauD/TfdA family dioxygenase [Aquihabitans sp.]
MPATLTSAASGALVDQEGFVAAAAAVGELVLGASALAALDAFAVDAGPAGSLLLSGLDVGEVPATPATPTEATGKDVRSELVLLAAARRLGEPVGYRPEHGGSIVQNLVPTRDAIGRQTSTSSGVDLGFHTETAFHPHRPRYLLLLCLRGDPAASTTLASIDDLLPALDAATVAELRQPSFRTGVDESFGGRPEVPVGPPRPVLAGRDDALELCWDAELTVGETDAARAALVALADAVARRQRHLVLASGDLLVVDNARCVHGRSPFSARFDGTDRWLQRSFVVEDLAPSAADRDGRVITTDVAALV